MINKRARAIGQWGLVVVFLSILLYFGDVSELFRVPTIDWPFILLVFLSTVGFTLIHNIRWTNIVKGILGTSIGPKTDFFQFYRWLLNSYALGTMIPSDISLAGVRTFYMNRTQTLSLPRALFSVLLDRFFDFIVFFALAVPSALFMMEVAGGMQVLFLLSFMMALIFLFISWKKGEGIDYLIRIYQMGTSWLSKLPVIGERIGGKWKEVSHEICFREGSVHQLMAWSFLKYFFLALRFYFTGRVFGADFSLVQGFFFIPFIQLVGMLNITPGGLGIVEIGSYGALKLMEVPESKIMVFVVGQRILLSCVTISLALMNHLIFFLRARLRKEEIE
jgi:uncharacterized protein (TIRG00374 family)